MQEYKRTHLAKVQRMNYPQNCLTFDISQEREFTNKRLMHLNVQFHATSHFSVEIHIEDRPSSLNRNSPNAKKSYSGPVIEIKNLTNSLFSKFDVSFRQTINVEERPFHWVQELSLETVPHLQSL